MCVYVCVCLRERERERERESLCECVLGVGVVNESEGRKGGRKFKLMHYCSCYNLLFKVVVPFLG